MALDLKAISLEMAAIIGALVCVLTGCLTEKQAYASIDWVTIFLFAGMMPVSTAMDKTGAGKLIAEWAVSLMGGSPTPIIMTSVLFIISCTLTQFMSNTAACSLAGSGRRSDFSAAGRFSESSTDGDRRSCILCIRNSGRNSAMYFSTWTWRL